VAFRVDEETVGFCLLLIQSSFYSELLIRGADNRSAAAVAMIGHRANCKRRRVSPRRRRSLAVLFGCSGTIDAQCKDNACVRWDELKGRKLQLGNQNSEQD